METDLIDAAASVLLGTHDGMGPSLIPGEDIERERVLTVCDELHEFIDPVIIERDNRQKRAEQFMHHNGFIRMDRIDNGRLVLKGLPPALTAVHNPVAIGFSLFGALVKRTLGNKMRVLGMGEGITPDLTGKLSFQKLKKGFGDFTGNGHLVDVDADLPCIEELEKSDLTCRIPQIGIPAHDTPVAGLPTELKGDRRQISGSFLENMTGNGRRPGIKNLVKPLLKAEVGNVMAAVYNGNIFRRKGLSDDAAENSGGIAGFGTGLDDQR